MIETATTTMVAWLYDELANPRESKPTRYQDSFELEMFELRRQLGFDALCEQLGLTPVL